MMKTLYDLDSGKIKMNEMFSSEESFLLNEDDEVGYADGRWDAETHYILNGQPTERPASPVTLSDLTLLGVPAGSTLTIASASLSTSNGESYDAEGDVELEFPLSGTYRLRVECWPYKDWTGEVVAP